MDRVSVKSRQMANQQSTCFNCNLTGLPVFISLYSVAPRELNPTLPPGISGARVVEVDVSSRPEMPPDVKSAALDSAQYGYSLSVPRMGYLYVLYETCHRGENLWEVYTAYGDGCMVLQPSRLQIKPPADKLSCGNQGHIPVRTHYLVVEKPEDCGTIWIAFSERRWTDATFDKYTTNAGLRAKRMQPFQPLDWIQGKGKANLHAVEATVESLGHVLQYRANVAQYAKVDHAGEISLSEKGDYSEQKLARQSFRYPFVERTGQAERLIKQMHVTGKRPDGKSHRPVLFAAWDAIGITHELHGFRSEAAGRVAQYHETERAMQVSALGYIETAQKTLEAAAVQGVEQRSEMSRQVTRSRQQGAAGAEAIRKQGDNYKEPVRGHHYQIADLLDQWEAKDVPSRYTGQLNEILRLSYRSGWDDPKQRPTLQSDRDKKLTRLQGEVEKYLTNRNPKHQNDVSNAAKKAWPDYESCVVRTVEQGLKNFKSDYCLETFKKNNDQFLNVAAALINARTIQLIKWLDSPLFIDTLNDYDPRNLECGNAFENVIASAIHGIADCDAGRAKIDKWVKELSATKETSLFWRAFALNQEHIAAQVDAGLKAAMANIVTFDSKKFDTLLSSSIDYGKSIYSLYMAAAQLHDANTAKVLAQAIQNGKPQKSGDQLLHSYSQLRALSEMGAGDRLILTCGHAVFKLFGVDKLGDTVGEHLTRHLFNIRGLIHPQDSADFIKGEVKERVLLKHQLRSKQLNEMRTAEKDKLDRQLRAREISVEHHKRASELLDRQYDGHTNKLNRKAFRSEVYFAEALRLEDEMRHDQKTVLGGLWKRFLSSGDQTAQAAYIRDRRLVAIVGLLEFSNLVKLVGWDVVSQGKDDSKVVFQIAAAAMGVASAAAEMSALSVKYMFGEASMSFHRLKLAGGVLAGAAGGIGAALDIQDGLADFKVGKNLGAALYGTKAMLGAVAATLTILSALGSAAPLVERLIGKRAATAALRAVGERATHLLATRYMLFTVGGWLTVGAIAVQVIIMLMDDDDLQKAIRRSAFGIDYKKDPFSNAEKQNSAFSEALGLDA